MERIPETILGVQVEAPAREPERVLDTVVDLTSPQPARRPPGPRGAAARDFAEVAHLVSTGVRPGDAIVQVARETGKSRDTIQNNYYRTKRKLAADYPTGPPETAPSRPGRQATEASVGTRRPRSRPADADRSDVGAIAAQLLAATDALVAAAAAQATELADLRARLAAARSALT